MLPILIGLSSILGVILTILWIRFERYQRIINAMPGPPTIPLMGNAHQIGTVGTNFYRIIMEWAETYRSEGVYKFWLGFRPVVTVYRADLLSTIMNASNTKKSIFYRFLYPWLREGLLLSYGQKWQKRRRMLTPAFHYSILEDFMSVFQQQSVKMVQLLQEKANTQQEFDIYPYLANNALDIMLSTTMGVNINAQEHKSPYVDAVYRISRIILERVGRPWTYNESIFRLTSLGREHYRMLAILHGFSRKVIEDRWREYKGRQGSEDGRAEGKHEGPGEKLEDKKKRLVFLDLLIESAMADPTLSVSDVQEEVDAFMFAGHDTSAATAGWAVYNLGRHQEWQERIRAEIESCLGLEQCNAGKETVSQAQITELKLLDCFLKESMRLFTTVMAISRELLEDSKIGKYDCPKGTTIQILMSALHRDPEHFPDPDRFDPERWMLEDKRHPLCYLPFSAGIRSCIGQKFGQMAIKVVLVSLLRNFRIHCNHNHDEYTRQDGELVLRPSGGCLLVKLEKLRK